VTQSLHDVPSPLKLAEVCHALSSEAQSDILGRGVSQGGGRSSTQDHELDFQAVGTALKRSTVTREQRDLAPPPASCKF